MNGSNEPSANRDTSEELDHEDNFVTGDAVTEEPYEEDTEDLYKNRITIDDINIVSEMNTSQMAIQEEEQNNGVPTHVYNLRRRPTKRSGRISLAISDGNGNNGDNKDTETEAARQYVTIHPKVHAHIMFTQMNVRQGLLTFGDKGNEAISKELKQLHDKRAITPVQHSDMTTEEKRKVLRYLMFLKENRDGTIKARGCADGGPQREYTRKEQVSSLTVSLEAMMLSCAIDVKEGRYVIVTDIPGAFLHTEGGRSTHDSGGEYC